ncbi:speedy protein 1-A-like [Eleutherodactylus coqui]|uniref:speedy protein 1-A-like n=1 Tax=Eleutherodactylus coqui TaxID=57060 RepID=UPI0034635822
MDAIIKFLRFLFGRDDVGSSFPGRGEDSGRTRKRERSPCDEEVQERPQKRRKEDRSLQQEEMAVFFRVLDDPNIRTFLTLDSCMRISDKYLLAMVFVYFIRAGLQTEEYHKNFFAALFLANQMEEEVGFRHEIYQWAFGYTWMQKRQQILHDRNLLLLRIGFRALVDRDTCEQVMAVDPLHWAWRRERPIHHSRAFPMLRRNVQQVNTYGPWSSLPPCMLCRTMHLSLHARGKFEDQDE